MSGLSDCFAEGFRVGDEFATFVCLLAGDFAHAGRPTGRRSVTELMHLASVAWRLLIRLASRHPSRLPGNPDSQREPFRGNRRMLNLNSISGFTGVPAELMLSNFNVLHSTILAL